MTVEVFDDLDHVKYGDGSIFTVVQRGIWWWKTFFIAYPIADTAAGGINSGIWYDDVKSNIPTREQARIILHQGNFPYDI